MDWEPAEQQVPEGGNPCTGFIWSLSLALSPMVQYQAWLISDLDKGADASSASSLMTQGWEERPIPQRDVQLFS